MRIKSHDFYLSTLFRRRFRLRHVHVIKRDIDTRHIELRLGKYAKIAFAKGSILLVADLSTIHAKCEFVAQ